MNLEEYFKDIPGYEGLYQASNLGRIKSLPKKCGFLYRKERILKPTPNKKRWGYVYISLQHNDKRRNWLLHRVIALTFIKNPENKKEINHIDGNKSNNSITNLEWCTRKENVAHGIKNKLLLQCIPKKKVTLK